MPGKSENLNFAHLLCTARHALHEQLRSRLQVATNVGASKESVFAIGTITDGAVFTVHLSGSIASYPGTQKELLPIHAAS